MTRTRKAIPPLKMFPASTGAESARIYAVAGTAVIDRVRRYAAPIAATIIAVAAGLYLCVLDRIPPYIDESLFNYPALKLLSTGTMAWRVGCDAPHWDVTWGYHGLMYPLLQAGMFRLLDVSWFTVRFGNVVAANAAVALICVALHRWRWRLSSVALALAWIGDRALRETALGRPEGLALLMLGIALVCLVGTIRQRIDWRLSIAMMALGFGAATTPTVVASVVAVLALVLYLSPDRRRTLAYAVVGLVPPCLVVAMLIGTKWREAIEQFHWHAQRDLSVPALSRLYWFNWSLGWSRTEVYLMALGVAVIVMAALIQTIRRHERSGRTSPNRAILLVTGVLAVSTLCSRPPQSMHPYHLVLLAPFAVLSLLAVANCGPGRLRLASRVWLGLMALAWLPSLAQNVLELRAPFAEYAALDPDRVSLQFQNVLPPHAAVDVDSSYFVSAYRAGLSFEVLPWYPCVQQFDDARWLILRLSDWQAQRQQLEGRWSEVQERYGASRWFHEQYVIVAPRTYR